MMLKPDRAAYDFAMSEFDDARVAEQVGLEVAFYHLKGRLPAWAIYIERVEVVGESLIWVFRDRREIS